MGRSRFRRAGLAVAATGLMVAAVAVTLRNVPTTHRPPRVWVGWDDRGTVVREQVERWGFDRYGYVHQSRLRQWEAAAPDRLDALRRAHAAGEPPDLWPTQSWRLQWTNYGGNHVYLPGGVSLAELGRIDTLPYTAFAWACLTPTLVWGGTALARRIGHRVRR